MLFRAIRVLRVLPRITFPGLQTTVRFRKSIQVIDNNNKVGHGLYLLVLEGKSVSHLVSYHVGVW
jgi:hypothetical protein